MGGRDALPPEIESGARGEPILRPPPGRARFGDAGGLTTEVDHLAVRDMPYLEPGIPGPCTEVGFFKIEEIAGIEHADPIEYGTADHQVRA